MYIDSDVYAYVYFSLVCLQYSKFPPVCTDSNVNAYVYLALVCLQYSKFVPACTDVYTYVYRKPWFPWQLSFMRESRSNVEASQ